MLYVMIVCALVAADQALKYWTVTHLALGESAPFLPGLMQFKRLHNYGAAWSSFSGKTALLIVVTALLLIAVTVLVAKGIVRHPLGTAGCLLILGGGAGNIIDRLAHGYVVDMFDLLLFDYPIFNLADCFVVVGVILAAVYYLFLHDKKAGPKKESGDDPTVEGNN